VKPEPPKAPEVKKAPVAPQKDDKSKAVAK